MNNNKEQDKYTVKDIMETLDSLDSLNPLDYIKESDTNAFFEIIDCAIWKKSKNFLEIINENLSHLDDSMRVDQKILFIQYFKEEGRRTNGDEKRLKEVAEEIANKDFGNRPSIDQDQKNKAGFNMTGYANNFLASLSRVQGMAYVPDFSGISFNSGFSYKGRRVAS